jgi:hypothetical protein
VIEQADLLDLEKALDALEVMHDAVALGDENVRRCLCSEAASWRRGINVTAALRQRLGMRPRLTDQPVVQAQPRSAAVVGPNYLSPSARADIDACDEDD